MNLRDAPITQDGVFATHFTGNGPLRQLPLISCRRANRSLGGGLLALLKEAEQFGIDLILQR